MENPEIKTENKSNETAANQNGTAQNGTAQNETNYTDTKTYSADEYKQIASEKKAIAQQVKDLQAQIKKREDDDLVKSGDLQAQLTAANTKASELEKKAEELESLRTEKQELEDGVRKDLTANMSKEQKEYLKDKSISDIRAFIKIAAVKSATDNDSGYRATSPNDIKLSNADEKRRTEMGLTADQMIEFNNRINKPKT
ncbi:MAG: hypothetical protein M3R36_19650 [Bacteroidota bacterium]|nr:hypothetical protein [Bacteroidota bacterium]